MKDEINGWDIEASGCDVGGQENSWARTVHELREVPLSNFIRVLSVERDDGLGGKDRWEDVLEVVDAVTGCKEHNCLLGRGGNARHEGPDRREFMGRWADYIAHLETRGSLLVYDLGFAGFPQGFDFYVDADGVPEADPDELVHGFADTGAEESGSSLLW